MRVLSILLIGGLLCLGCGPKDNGEVMPDRYDQLENDASTAPASGEEVAINIGDVESYVYLAAMITEEAASETIKVDLSTTLQNRVAICTVDIYPPYPETLPIAFYVNTEQPFEDTPIAIRAKALREKEVIGSFATIVSKKEKEMPSFLMDAFVNMDAVPETMSIYARAEVFLSEPGTEAASIDPQTFTVEDLMCKTVILSNPIRINFHQEALEPAPEQ